MTIQFQISKVVHYDQTLDVPDELVEPLRSAIENNDRQHIQEFLDSRLDAREVLDADDFEVLNIVFDAD